MKHAAALGVLPIALAMLCGSVQAQGQLAYTATTATLRAGPARDYPVVAVLAPGLQILVQGCIPDYSWCDVIAGRSRGWMYAGNINYQYQNGYAPLLTVGPVIGFAIIGFSLNDYWGRHYRDRRWYGERHRWEGRAVPAPGAHFGPSPAYRTPGYAAPRPYQHEVVPNRQHPQTAVPPQAYTGPPEHAAPRARPGQQQPYQHPQRQGQPQGQAQGQAQGQPHAQGQGQAQGQTQGQRHGQAQGQSHAPRPQPQPQPRPEGPPLSGTSGL